MEAEAEPRTQPDPSASPAAEGDDDRQEEDETEVLMEKVQSLVDKITANPENPSPNVLHALATILEAQELSYMEDADQSSTNNGRSSHNVGRIGNLIRENEELFELITSKFLGESRYSVSVQAATTRLLFSCSLTWMFPHVFEDDVLANLRGWVKEEIPHLSGDDHYCKHNITRKTSDSEILCTYSTGLLATCLTCDGQLVEDVLESGISAKLMRYLRLRVLGDTSTIQKEGISSVDNKSALTTTCPKIKEEGRGRLRLVSETLTSILDVDTTRMHRSEKDHHRDAAVLDEHASRDRERSISRIACGDECGIDEEPPDSMVLEVDAYEAEADGEEKCNTKDIHESKTKPYGKSHREDFEENSRDDSSRRKTNRGFSKLWGNVRSNEGASESEQALASPSSASRSRSVKDRSGARYQDIRRVSDAKKSLARNDVDNSIPQRGDNDDCFKNCKVGNREITDLVKKAVRAAESEARAANAPAIAIWAAGDDAAEVVKTAALEEYEKTNNEEAAVLAASRAVSTVIDAGSSVPLRNSSNVDSESGDSKATDAEVNEDIVEFSIPDNHSLAKLREKFCIQCLVVLGEYVEVLGPVIHENGVDVCLALLQQSLEHKETSHRMRVLPEILRLISALAAHRKFAESFVDCGGMQKLLTVPRNAQTFLGLSSCLFTICSIQAIMERVCALPSNVVHQIVELALQLQECPQDQQARKNAALFFAAAFVFRAIIEAFDAHDGLQKLLSLLNDAASVRSGVPAGQSSNGGSLRNGRSAADVLTSLEKQIAYHTCGALRQYFRSHLRLLVDSIRPTKNIRSAPRNVTRTAYKPLNISNEEMDEVFRQIQMDRKLGSTLVRARWSVADKFLVSNGHITMLELCQAPPVERYLHDLLQYALGILQIVTLVPYSRKPIVNATLSNDRVGISVILDAANGAGYVEPEIVEPALYLLINLVCPPPSISNKPSSIMQGQQASSCQTGNGSAVVSRDRNGERNITERAVNVPIQNEPGERNVEPASVGRSGYLVTPSSSVNNTMLQVSSCTVASRLVGDRRISLGAGAGCAGLAAQLEQGYRQAREAVRANNGIKVLLQLLQPRMVTSPAALDCLRALTCRVLLGLARDDTIAHILTKLQVERKLSELIRDYGSQSAGGEQNRWQTELNQVAVELIGVVTSSGRASTLAASDAATPTLKRIERAAIAAATPISYHSRELLLLMHEHLQASGLEETAATLLKEAKLTPLPSLAAPSSLAHQASGQEASSIQIQWPSTRAPCGFMSDKSKNSLHKENSSFRSDSAYLSSKKKTMLSSAHCHSKFSPKLLVSPVTLSSKVKVNSDKVYVTSDGAETPVSVPKFDGDMDTQVRTPILLPMKRKSTDIKESGWVSSAKRLNTGNQSLRSPSFTTPNTSRRSGLYSDATLFCTPMSTPKEYQSRVPSILSPDFCEKQSSGLASSSQHGLLNEPQPSGSERLTLDSIVVQYLKHQHRQCSAPITTLPPLSLLQPHVCPEPRRSLDAPSNVTSRLSAREFRSKHGGINGLRKDNQFVYSRVRPWRSCRDDTSALFTCVSFLGDSSRIATGGHAGDLKVFDSNNNKVLDSCASHQSPITLLQSHFSGDNQLLLSSSSMDVRLWDASSISSGPKYSFEGIKAARFGNSGRIFSALRLDTPQGEILLYDVHTCQLDSTLTVPSINTSTNDSGRGCAYSLAHFSASDSMLLWRGVLWDRRVPSPIHRFDLLSDYGGGGFHPAGNEVIINSEVWDLRKFRLLQNVPSLDQTTITFNASGDVIYAILRRNLEDVTSAFNMRRVKHPLFSAFRTVDAVNYTDIATIPVDRCVLNFATEPTDSFVGIITMDDQDEMYSSVRVYEIGRRKPTDDDSDPDDAVSEEEEQDDEGDDDSILDFNGDSDGDDMSNDSDGLGEFDDEEDDGDFMMNGGDFGGILEIVTEGDEDDNDDSDVIESFSSDDEDDL